MGELIDYSNNECDWPYFFKEDWIVTNSSLYNNNFYNNNDNTI